MNQTLIDKIKAMADSESCYEELERVANVYLNTLAAEETAAKKFLAELETDVVKIDDMVAFAHSKGAVEYFKGNTTLTEKFIAHTDALKAAGAEYCNCFACTVGREILADKETLFSGNHADRQALTDKIKAMVASPSCHPRLKQVATDYLNALAIRQTAAKNFIVELEADIVDIDELVHKAKTGGFVPCFGEEGAKVFVANALALQASGAKYCNCFASQTGLEILEDKDEILA